MIEVLLRQFTEGRCAELSNECTVMLGRLVSNLITYQKVKNGRNYGYVKEKVIKLLCPTFNPTPLPLNGA